MPLDSRRSEDTRKKIHRLISILRKLDNREKCSPATLSEDFCITDRTVQRDIDVLNNAGFSVLFDRELGTYRFTDSDYTLKDLELDKEELVTLLIGRQMAGSLGKPFEKAYQSLLRKVHKETGFKTRERISKIAEQHNFWVDIDPMEGFEKVEKQYNAINEAMGFKKEIMLTYKAMGSQEKTKRAVAPYGLFFCNGLWYAIGYCNLRKDIRIFALDCVKDFRITDKPYSIPADFNIGKYFEPGWQMMRYGDPVEVVLKFSKEYARWIKRRKWHPTQVIEDKPGGSIIFKVTVQGTTELKWWTYHWLPYCEVIAPAALKKEVVGEMKKMLKIYGER